jgi:hypothetical protein
VKIIKDMDKIITITRRRSLILGREEASSEIPVIGGTSR